MIRFSCPGCGATYSVDESKGGKTGKCPKCTAHFQIPDAAAAPPPPPPPPQFPAPPPSFTPGDVGQSTVEINPCPGCEARLSVNGSDIGIDVECPYCKTVYKATRAGTRPSSTVIPPPPMKLADGENERPSRRSSRKDDDDEDARPSRRSRRDEDDEEERPSRRSRRDEDDEEERPSRRSRRDEDDEDEDEERPRRRKKRRRSRNLEPHRGTMIITFAILGWAICIIFGIMAWTMGSQDIKKMDAGLMDPDGRGITQAGKIIAMIQCIFAAVVFVLWCCLGIAGGGKGQ